MSDLTNRIKAKYPQYANIDDATLEQRVLAKYPQYKNNTATNTSKPSLSGFGSNVIKSAGENLTGMVSGIANFANPDMDKNTGVQIGRLAYGGLQKLDPTKDKTISKGIANATPLGLMRKADEMSGKTTDYQPQAEAVGNFYKERYGIGKAMQGDIKGAAGQIGNTLYNDPVGVALDVSALAGAGAGIAGATGKAGLANKLNTVARVTDPVSIAGKATKFIPKPKTSIRQWLASQAETIPTRGMGNPTLIGKAKGMSPIPMNELFEKYNLWDRSPEVFMEGAKKSGSILDNITSKYKGKIEVKNIINALDSEIKRLEKSSRFSDTAMMELQELIKRRDMLKSTYRGKGLATPTSITEIKNLFQRDVPDSQFGLPTSESAKARGTKTAYKQILTELENKIPGTKGLGREASAMRKLFEVAKGAERRSMAAQPIKLKGLLGAGAGATIGGIPGAVGGYFLNELLNSPAFLKYVTKGMSGASKAKMPNTNVFKKLYQAGKVERVVNPNSSW